jgi:hypothetical protein
MIVLLVIYTTVCVATVKSTLELSTSKGHAIISSEYLSRDKKAQPSVVVTPNININPEQYKIDFEYKDVPAERSA